jgi:hypothetical protein
MPRRLAMPRRRDTLFRPVTRNHNIPVTVLRGGISSLPGILFRPAILTPQHPEPFLRKGQCPRV